jgi:hypothetical protein
MNVEPLPPETLAGLAALHVPLPYRPHIDSLRPTETTEACAIDFEAWPCQVARLLATIEDRDEQVQDIFWNMQEQA